MSLGWGFTEVSSTGARFGGDPTKYALDKELGVFVREVLQNSNDQGPIEDGPVEVHFRLKQISGKEFEKFREAIRWDELVTEHIQALPDERARGIRQYRERIEADGELLLLTVEDRNTTGLTGSEDDDDSNFTALVRDVLYSHKRDDTAGGSYGLGKAVLWSFSGISTVVFNSTLSDEPEGKSSPRVIARTQLPTHKSPDGESIYQGQGWFGDTSSIDSGERPLSIWGDRADELAHQLQVGRPENVPGTSVTVVGFRDPTAEEQSSIEELADRILEAAVTNFWPAIEFGDLEVHIETPNEDRRATVEAVPKVRPFVECVARRFEADEELNDPGDVAVQELPVEMPDRHDGTPTTDGPVTLSVRLAKAGDAEDLINQVALFRGSGMVVRYYDRSRIVLGNRDFHAALVCGQARAWGDGEPTESDDEIDRFLRAAEPPEHDDWESTENLKDDYQLGSVRAVEELKSTVTDRLRNLVSENTGRGKLGPRRLAKRFPVGGGGDSRVQSTANERVLEGDTSVVFDDHEDRWTFRGFLEPLVDEHTGWSATVSLTRMAEDGPTTDTIEVASIEADNHGVECHTDDGVGKIISQSETGRVTIEGHSVRDPRRGETRIDIEGIVEIGGEE